MGRYDDNAIVLIVGRQSFLTLAGAIRRHGIQSCCRETH